MRLYEIQEDILQLTHQITVDEENDKILCDMVAIYAEIDTGKAIRK